MKIKESGPMKWSRCSGWEGPLHGAAEARQGAEGLWAVVLAVTLPALTSRLTLWPKGQDCDRGAIPAQPVLAKGFLVCPPKPLLHKPCVCTGFICLWERSLMSLRPGTSQGTQGPPGAQSYSSLVSHTPQTSPLHSPNSSTCPVPPLYLCTPCPTHWPCLTPWSLPVRAQSFKTTQAGGLSFGRSVTSASIKTYTALPLSAPWGAPVSASCLVRSFLLFSELS